MLFLSAGLFFLSIKMGGWKLEAAKMFLYMTFPVGIFYYFNQPEYFEEWMISMRRELYPPEKLMHRKEFDDAIRELREKREKEYLKMLEDQEAKSSSIDLKAMTSSA